MGVSLRAACLVTPRRARRGSAPCLFSGIEDRGDAYVEGRWAGRRGERGGMQRGRWIAVWVMFVGDTWGWGMWTDPGKRVRMARDLEVCK